MTSRARITQRQALVPIEATEDPIPCPPGLTQMQHEFALAYVRAGDGNASLAARRAGYALASASKIGWSLLHRVDVQAHIRNLTAITLSSAAPIAAVSMAKLALRAKSEMVRQQAAADILNRTGYRPPDRHEHVVSGGVTISIDLGD